MADSSSLKRVKRPNGWGSTYLRKDGRWVGEWQEQTPEGPKRRFVYARTRDAAEQKMRTARGEPLLSDVDFDNGSNVYFIQAATGGPIKIGVSSDVKKRLTALQMCCPVPLRVLHTIPGGGHSLETELHKRFAAWRLHGEWFDNVGELMALIRDFKKKRS